MRRFLTGVSALPIMVGGWLLAHWFSYRLVIPDPVERTRFLQGSGHQYFSYVPFIIAFCVSVLVVGLTLRVVGTVRGSFGGRVIAWPFGLLPPLMFAFEEYADRLVHDGTFQLRTAVQLSFIVGLLLQVPFGIAGYFVVRFLLRLAEHVGKALSAAAQKPAYARLSRLAPGRQVDLPRICVLAFGQVDRGPPVLPLR